MSENMFKDDGDSLTMVIPINQSYIDKFGIDPQAAEHIELITNQIAQDHYPVPCVIVMDESCGFATVVQLNTRKETLALFADIKRYIDKSATVEPSENKVQFQFQEKKQAQMFIQWLIDYKVKITEFAYPLADFII